MKNFLLGVGAQKAGTIWLSNYLRNHPNADMGFTKEYHIFDYRSVFDTREREVFLTERMTAAINSGTESPEQYLMLLEFLRDTEKYFDYFKNILSSSPKTLLTGDISPSYALLPPSVLTEIKDSFRKRAVNVKVVFIMRDPVERCISASRMALKETGRKFSSEQEAKHIEEEYRSEQYRKRTRYDYTVNNIEAVFDADQVFYTFYEDFFTMESIQSLCDFLSIPFNKPNLEKMCHASRTDAIISDELREKVANYYEPVYRFVSERFGREKTENLWSNARFLRNVEESLRYSTDL